MEMPAEHVADHRVRRVASRSDHQDVARLDKFQRMQHGAEVRRLATGGDGPSKKGRLKARRMQRLDRRIDLTVRRKIDDDRDGNPPPAGEQALRQRNRLRRMNGYGHLAFPPKFPVMGFERLRRRRGSSLFGKPQPEKCRDRHRHHGPPNPDLLTIFPKRSLHQHEDRPKGDKDED
jgi:hypothetical protein